MLCQSSTNLASAAFNRILLHVLQLLALLTLELGRFLVQFILKACILSSLKVNLLFRKLHVCVHECRMISEGDNVIGQPLHFILELAFL